MSDEEATQALRVLARHGIDAPVSQRAELISRLALEIAKLAYEPERAYLSMDGPVLDTANRAEDCVFAASSILFHAERAAAGQTNALTSGEESA